MSQLSQRLSGKIAVVTGIGGGIGRGCALMLARHGATVVGCDINAQTAQATAATAVAEGLAFEACAPVDLTQPEQIQQFIDHAGRQHGRIDVLVNAAAIQPHMAKIAEVDYEKQWLATMTGEVDLVVLACKAAWPYLLVGGKSSIINFASVSAYRASLNFGMGPHCAGKAAVQAVTRQMAVEGGPRIRANTIAPGLIVTPATEAAGATDGRIREQILARVPMKRLGQPEDIAWCAVFLASDEASWVTGADFSVDGGTMAC